MPMTYTLGPTSATEVTIIPEFDYSNSKDMKRSTIRAKSGKLYTYKWSDTKKIKFSANLFDNSDASIVNSWWDTQTKLIFFEYDGTTTTTTSVQIMNDSSPFAQRVQPYYTKYSGAIQLEEYL
jgi:hypothetical protein